MLSAFQDPRMLLTAAEHLSRSDFLIRLGDWRLVAVADMLSAEREDMSSWNGRPPRIMSFIHSECEVLVLRFDIQPAEVGIFI
jgi:hypothetical protein